MLRDLPRRLENLVRRIEPAFPAVRRWAGERLDLQVPAVGVSVLTHLMALSALGMIGYAATKPPVPEFRSEVVDTSLSDFAKLDTTEIAQIEETSITPVGGSFAPNNQALIVEKPITPPVESKPSSQSLSPQEIQIASVSLPKPTKLDNTVSINGSGAEHVDNVEGAVDRISIEIMRQLEKGRTLVVWAFDASGSLQAERERLAKYIDGVYAHIDDLDRSELTANEGMLTSVVSFGNDRKVLIDPPTTDRKTVVSAIGKVGLDKTGKETTFRTVAEIARKYARFTKNDEPYRVLCIVVTDEVGDDEENLETAIAASVAARMPVYVLGSPALFGRIDGFMDYTDPQTKQTFRHLPVRQGPEAAVVENLRLPFWYDGPQYELMDSG
ncbi:MAG TPA: vWA domain-containing protein, partial [Isosphaeraceae bacterium]|nr:vWA domain-containing protein [Isosphaeraceae bacterium]